MIGLLARIRAAARGDGPGRGDEGARGLRLLEWERVTDQIARRCLNAGAAAAVRARLPYSALEPIALRHTLADELRPFGDSGRWPPLADVSSALVPLEGDPPFRLEGPELVAMAAAAEALDALRDVLLERREPCPTWGRAAAEAASLYGIGSAVRRSLDRDGRVRDDASPLLARLRRACAQREQDVRSAVEAAMTRARNAGWTTGREVTLRGDRYCLPLRAGDSRRIPGIVHDRSATGNTLFVEPAEVVRAHNELTEMRLEAVAEERRILFELNRLVEQAAGDLLENAALLLLVDETRAALLWSRDASAARPRLAEGGPLRLVQARHPLLLEQGDVERVVPLDLELPPDRRALVISGPNAGGKSVALKTVGVCVLLAQSGWDVPAREDSRLPLYVRVLVDLGDEQSIAQSLSSFAAHLAHLGRFLESADARTLVLTDEIGSGTDPQEGTALAFAVLEELTARGATVLASTHFGLLKAAVADHPAMLNAAMDFDEATLSPRFTLRMGVPGSSHAFAIASRWGFPPELLERARRRVGEERVEVERLLADLQERTRETVETGERARAQEEESGRLRRELASRLKEIDRERRGELAEARRRGEEMLRQGRSEIERAIREIRSQGAAREVVRTARDRLAELESRLPAGPAAGTGEPVELREGDRVSIPHLGLTGRVVEVRGDRVTALADGLRLNLGRSAVEPLAGAGGATSSDAGPVPVASAGGDSQPRAGSASAGGGWRWQDGPPDISPEIDLRGERAEEGWERLDRLIDRAIPAGLRRLHVVHGVGTGRLREHLLDRLRHDPRVAAVHPAGPGPGQMGASVVILAGD
ncbi:MAG: Smr/MutS family protein [Candidatus Krumholzibacteriia bacterium]